LEFRRVLFRSRELLEHGRAQGMQPLVLRFDLAGELAALRFPTGNVMLDLEQAIPVGEALLDGAGHDGAPPPLAVPTDAAVVLAESSSGSPLRTIPRTSVSAGSRFTSAPIKLGVSRADREVVISLRQGKT